MLASGQVPLYPVIVPPGGVTVHTFVVRLTGVSRQKDTRLTEVSRYTGVFPREVPPYAVTTHGTRSRSELWYPT